MIVKELEPTFDKMQAISLLFYHLFLLLYQLGIRLVAPWNPKARQWVQGRKYISAKEYPQKTIWMHCSSLGEFEQGRPVLEALRKKYPQYPCIVSFFSPSGYEIRKNYAGADQVIYLPMDGQIHAAQMIHRINPALVLWVKYEYWYYYLAELKKREIPVLLISGIFRPGQPFFKWYGQLWRKMLDCFEHLFVQQEDSYQLLRTLNLDHKSSISGDTRFDRVADIAEHPEPVAHIKKFTEGFKIIVAGSSWEADEEVLVHFVKSRADVRLILAPHEISPERIKEIQKEFKDSFLYSGLHEDSMIPEKTKVLIIDNIGMLSKLYQYADLCYIGGGFGNGIHNILEAAVYYKPVLFGPVYQKFQEANDLTALGAAFPVQQALELESVMNKLLNEEEFYKKTCQIAGDYVHEKRGATQKIVNYVAENRLLIN